MKIVAGDDRTPWRGFTVLCDGVELRYCKWVDLEQGEALTEDFDADVLAQKLHRGAMTLRPVSPEVGRQLVEAFPQIARFVEPNTL